MTDKAFNLADLIIANEYHYAGCLGDPREHNLDPELIDISVGDVLEKISAEQVGEALRQALRVTIPAVVIAHLDNEDDTCHGCASEGRDGCEHECRPNDDGLCYEWCLPCQADMNREAAEVKAEWLLSEGCPDALASQEVLSVATNIGLVSARRTLEDLRARSNADPDRVATWEGAIERLSALAGPPIPSRRLEG